MGAVVTLVIPPKQDRHVYRRTPYLLTFDPTTKLWTWSFKMQITTNFSGAEPSYALAMKQAREHIALCDGVDE